MQVKHVINQHFKRLEPVDTLCHYCDTEHSQRMDDNYFMPIYKESDRTDILVYRSVKFKKIDIGIPRCANCKKIHESAAEKAQLFIPLSAVALVVLSFIIWHEWAIIAFLPAIIIGFLGTPMAENKIVRKKGIFTKRDGAERNETVQELVIQGWTLTKPSV